MSKGEHDVQECFQKLIKMVLAMDFSNEEFMHCLIHVVRYLILRTLSDDKVRGFASVDEETVLQLGDAICQVEGCRMIRDSSGGAVLRFTLQMILTRLLTRIDVHDLGDFLMNLFQSFMDEDESDTDDDESDEDDEPDDGNDDETDEDDKPDDDDPLIPG